MQNIQYQYYGAGLLSNYDRFPEHQKLIVGNKKKKEKKPEKKVVRMKKDKPTQDGKVILFCTVTVELEFNFEYNLRNKSIPMITWIRVRRKMISWTNQN